MRADPGRTGYHGHLRGHQFRPWHDQEGFGPIQRLSDPEQGSRQNESPTISRATKTAATPDQRLTGHTTLA